MTTLYQLLWACTAQTVALHVTAPESTVQIGADLPVPPEASGDLVKALQALPGVAQVRTVRQCGSYPTDAVVGII